MKKVLSLVLALMMVFSSFAFATPTDVVGTDYEDAVNKLMGVGVLTGYPDGTYKPANTITRAEFAAIAVRLLGLESAADYAKGTTKFSDVPATHWSSGYVNIAVDQGIINGYPDGTYMPAKQVTYAEAITILVRVLGYAPEVDEKGTWPSNYIAKAANLEITDGVNFVGMLPATRGDIAIFADQSLEVPLMIRVGFGDEATYEVSELTLLADKIKAESISGKVMETLTINEDFERAVKLSTGAAAGYKLASGTTYDFDAVLGQDVTVWLNKDGKVVSVDKDNTVVSTVLLTNLADTTTSFKVVSATDKNATKTYYFGKKTGGLYTTTGADAYVVYNDTATDTLKIADYNTVVAAELNLEEKVDLFLDDDGYVVGFRVYNFEAAFKATGVNGTTIEKSGEDVVLAGQVYNYDLATIAKDDYIYHYKYNTNKQDADDEDIYAYNFIERAAKVTGEFTKKNADGTSVVVGGVTYKLTLGGATFFDIAEFTTSLLGEEVELTFDMNGYVNGLESVDSTIDSNYAVILNAGATAGSFGTQTVNIKLVNTANEVVTYALDSAAVLTGAGVNAGLQGAMLSTHVITPGVNTVDITSGAGTTLTLSKALTGYAAVVKYKLNSDGEIKELEVLSTSQPANNLGAYDVDTKKLGTHRITSDTLIYSEADEEFFALKDLTDGVTYAGYATTLADTSINEAEFVVIGTGTIADTSEYAYYLEKAQVADGYEVSLFVNGELKTYTTEDDDVAVTSSLNDLVKFTLSNGKMTTIATQAYTATGYLHDIVLDDRIVVLTNAGTATDYDVEATATVAMYNIDAEEYTTYALADFDEDNADYIYYFYDGTDSDSAIDYILVTKPE